MKLMIYLAISVLLSAFLFMAQLGIDAGAEAEGVTAPSVFSYDGSHIKEFNKGDTTAYELESNFSGKIPGGSGQIADGDGNIFTDVFKVVRNWLLSVTGIKYILGVLNAVPNFLTLFLPNPIAFALGYVWHSLNLFALIFWLKGGGQ